jgi:DNA repair protein SbcC/Rad50
MMIFKRWFKPKWQHENASIRQLAIAELDQSSNEHKEILHELAFNDGVEAVRRTALERLNEFSLWWQASKHESAERLKQFAEQQLIAMLLQNQVSTQLKQQFIAECNRTSILEKLALTESDAGIKFTLIQRLGRNDFYQTGILDDKLSTSQRLALLQLLDDDKALDKISRQLPTGELSQAVQDKIALRLEQKLKPERVRKQVVLLLAKLNSVRENNDIEQAQQKFALYQQHWLDLASDLQCLTDAADFTAKYQKVCLLTENAFAPRLAELAALQNKQAAAAAQQVRYQEFVVSLSDLATQIAADLAAGELDAVAAQEPIVATLSAAITDADLTSSQRQPLFVSLKALQQQLDQLPQLAEALALTARLLAEQAAIGLPSAEQDITAAYQQFKQWQQQWQRQVKVLKQLMPQSFTDSYQQLSKQWQQHCEPLLGQQEKLQRQFKSKLAEFKRLHQAGKYNVLFGLFKGIARDYESLTALSQQQLASEFQQVSQQVEDLADLQAYIATPRKQELLAVMQQLAIATDVTPADRASQVKQSRALWNTLGRADASLEEQLTQDFNLACEQAFAPCREYFAEQDALRAQNAAVKLAIIEQLEQQLAAGITGKALDTQLQQSLKEWQQSGSVEKVQFEQLQPRFSQLVNQLKQQQKAEQQQNAAAKQQLITMATQLCAGDSTEQVSAQLKVLQQQWKNIGFAGRGQDQQLWQAFRGVCDQWFAQREAAKQQQLSEQATLRTQHAEQLSSIAEQIEAATTHATLQQSLTQLNQLYINEDKELLAQKRQLQQQTEQRLADLQTESAQAKYRQLLDALSLPEVQLSDVPPIYRLVFNQQQEKSLSRADLTLALEWAAGQPSPATELARRQQVQMLLLTDKHNSGESINQEQLLARWLQYGPVSQDEQALLQRVRGLYLTD